MSKDRLKRKLVHHLNDIISEIHRLDNNCNIPLMNFSISSQLTTVSQEEICCPYLSHGSKPAILHSTANSEYRKKSSKMAFAFAARATSTPKSSPQQTRLLLKPHQTSTPRRSKRHSTVSTLPANNIIPLKRLLYNKKDNQHRRRHSAVPFPKRSIVPRLHPIEENQQWI
ncbi:unnamed protein product [Adineta ricciae]|uniref:Uncharacterized protein n=1 Tax=Adineta ricciae TaxID=249248 RepID=A0A815WDM8_ADIRI|nr:unnamed protein product [Adineta ricciae]